MNAATGVQSLVERIAADCRGGAKGGRNASYIPELANVDPELFSISVMKIDGDYYATGDDDALFSMQSMSKVISLAYLTERLGAERVFSRVGMEPCAEPFNSIAKLEIASNTPLNPFINSGAIVVSSMLCESLGNRALGELLAFAGLMSGRAPQRPFTVNERVYRSESSTADRNRSLGYFMKSNGAITTDVEETLALYFNMCSVEADTRDLSGIGATVANGGVNPLTGERVLATRTSHILLGLMSTCGLYNESGEFAVKVGVPAKSGVSGGILCAVPGRMGAAVFSPPLDERGNSVAGIEALIRLSNEMKLRGF